MGFIDFLKKPKIDEGVDEFRAKENAVLLDVRTPVEFSMGRIPGSKNIPVQNIELAEKEIPDLNTPIYVYCRSGARSHQAVVFLKRMGYSTVIDLGGIVSYSGKVER